MLPAQDWIISDNLISEIAYIEHSLGRASLRGKMRLLIDFFRLNRELVILYIDFAEIDWQDFVSLWSFWVDTKGAVCKIKVYRYYEDNEELPYVV